MLAWFVAAATLFVVGDQWLIKAEYVLQFDNFDAYKAHHNKTYLRPFNEERGRAAFDENLKLIDEHNSNESQSYKLRPNHLADMVSYDTLYLGTMHLFFFCVFVFSILYYILLQRCNIF